MGATGVYGLPYPELGDTPNVPSDIQDLAEEVEDELVRVDADIATIQAVVALFATGATVQNFQSPIANFTSTASYTETFTSSNTPAALTFVAPPSGKVLIHNRSWLDNSGASARTFISYVLRTGGTIGSGTVIQAADDDRAIHGTGDLDIECGATFYVSGLTGGATYNVRQAGKVTSGTGESQNRELIVQPLWK
jgi:hypothetical protein